MEQYTKGVNTLIPHAVWYNDRNVTFLPELSWRNELYRDSLPAFNKFLSRLNYILRQEGRHVADIAVLYPIESLQGEHVMDGELGFYEGGVMIPNTDYTHVSALLTDTLGRDFTYLHPEVLSTKCRVKKGLLHLDNQVNKETFRLIIIPGVKTISLTALRQVESFFKSGGNVIFTTQLPEKSVEPGQDKEVKDIISRILGVNASYATAGKAFFVEKPGPDALKTAIEDSYPVPDVAFEAGHELNYIHKELKNQSVYYFANLKDQPYQANVVLRGKLKPVLLNPHTGQRMKVAYEHKRVSGMETTTVTLPVEKHSSVFLIDNIL